MNEAGHRERVSYARVLMFFQSKVQLDDNSVEDVSLAYIEEFWEYKRNNNSSLVGSGNLQLYAPQVYYVIPVERILCKADIMRDPVTPRIPAGDACHVLRVSCHVLRSMSRNTLYVARNTCIAYHVLRAT